MTRDHNQAPDEPARVTLVIPDELHGRRLDQALAVLLPDLSRAAAQRLIDEGRVAVGYGTPRSAKTVTRGEEIVVTLPERVSPLLIPSTLPLAVVYQDDDVLIVDKPAGLAVHPGADRRDQTLVHALLGRDPAIAMVGDAARPGIVHRLDKDTSGLIAVARTPGAHAYLSRQWRDREVTKRYWALVVGHPRRGEGIVEMPIGRDPRRRKRMAPALDGRPARTRYRVDQTYRGFSLLDVAIETGRTHQIRVHLAAIGHPVSGDALYGGRTTPPGLTRQFLHAYLLALRLPSTGEIRTFTSPLPDDLARALDRLEPTP